ncbi:UDP-3-O-(3-hydroxymyristoyl)glucosamine N-acyltransferase [Candidatus Babeliales bacterium]|nr:UDP-3-O-(3-hydroxymyristoyl)glucosamine N-acyltransferase [Candidatus Babeliales bacterium]
MKQKQKSQNNRSSRVPDEALRRRVYRGICVVAGASGGHITPALVLGKQWIEKKPDGSILFFGTNFRTHPSIHSSSPLVPSDLQGKSYRGISQWAIVEDNVSIGAGAVIEDDAKIGYGATIGANVFVGQGAVVGCGVVLHPGVKILERSVVGDNTIIHSGAVIGSDGFGYRVMKTGLRKITHIGIVIIGKSVEIGANTTIDRAEFDQTVIGDGVKLDNQVHIAHNVKIGPHTAILAQTGIAGSTIIGAGCQIGGQVAIKDHLTIGNEVKIVSKSAVMKNLKDGEIVCGIPSMPFSQWKRMMVALARLPELLKKNRTRKTFWQKLFS